MPRFDIDSLDNRDERWLERFVRIVEGVLEPYYRAEVSGLERIPPGAALYVGNHNGGLMIPEAFLFGAAVYRELGLAGMPYGLGHEFAISLPVLNEITAPLGAVRASHENGLRLFEAGHKVLVYPGGDYEAMRPYRDRDRIVFGGRRGYVRLALRGGVPLVPVVAAGAHATFRVLTDGRRLARLLRADRLLRVKVWPITLCLPWGVVVGPQLLYLPWPSKILIEVLEPIHFDRQGEEAAADEAYVERCARQVESIMQVALTRLAHERERRR
ncbi:MAG: lysophospholipid acyltransferase family protein [Deltaproteobacteria bacterium]|nr:lysophospholipid acyltransferase family protein [Deltaproteobacteria bacterium]